ncbi:MAG: trypsin-like peptidase domain-containing protein, partial [Thermoguttaceae bacterium]
MIDSLRPFAALCLLVSAAAAADDSAAVRQEAFRQAVARVLPAVVQVETVGGAEEVEGLAVGTGPTTGLVIGPEGFVVSSSLNFAHSPSGILVRLPSGQRLAAQLVATDHHLKLSLLKVEAGSPLAVPALSDPKSIRVGQWAIAVGKAFDPEQP